MFASMKSEASYFPSTESGGPGVVASSRREVGSPICANGRLQRIAGALLIESRLPLSLRPLIAEELLTKRWAVDRELAARAEGVLGAAKAYGSIVDGSSAVAETELLSRELTG